MDKKGKAIGTGTLFAVFGVGLLVILGMLTYGMFYKPTQQAVIGAGGGNAPTGGCENFQGLQTANMAVGEQNEYNTTNGQIEYLAGTVDFVVNGQALDTDTTTVSGTVTLTPNPCQVGTIWALGSSTVNGDDQPATSNAKNSNWIFSALDASGKKYGDVSMASRLNFIVRLAGSNTNITSSSASSNPTTASQTLGAGQFAYELQPSLAGGSGTAWGSFKKGGIVGVDLSTTVYDKSTIRLSSGYMTVSPVACPAELVDNDAVDVCFAIPQYTGNFATLQLIGTAISAPSNNDIKIYFEDVQPVKSGAGYTYTTHVGTTNKGVAQDVVTIDVA